MEEEDETRVVSLELNGLDMLLKSREDDPMGGCYSATCFFFGLTKHVAF